MEEINIKERDYYFDNIKGLLILLVILGNSLEHAEPTVINTHFFLLLLYLFHMPLFTFVSGYFCKKSKRTTQEKVIKIFKVYVGAQIFYTLFEQIVFRNEYIKLEFFSPRWTLWYLLSLMSWYILSDFIKDKKRWLIVSICLALYIGMDYGVGSYASISRTFFFLPFFIAGMIFEKRHIEYLKSKIKYILVAALFIVGILFYIRKRVPLELFFEYSRYTSLFGSAMFPFIMRVFHYIGGFLISFIILAIMTPKKTALSKIGENSLVLYVLHSGVTKILCKFSFIKYSTPLYICFSETAIIATTIALSFGYVALKKKIKNYIDIKEEKNISV